ncbi:uncharacterized protein LOC122856263 [Aphidius gifuensis]|uniref:uncharacterized protein LOC122856263 n=1 Tax=Aphidius gifuensis TaxID=684658 RepID=UPI001CDCCEE8|nr:uncharacterized protein LOC122856263 [Aphidius gifuensis]
MEVECVENNFIEAKNIEKKAEFIIENSQQQLLTDTEELSDPDDDDFFIERRSDDAIIDDIKKWILRPIIIYNKNDDINPMIPDEEFELISKNGAEKAVDLFLNNSKLNPLYVRSYVYDLSLLINKQNPYNANKIIWLFL